METDNSTEEAEAVENTPSVADQEEEVSEEGPEIELFDEEQNEDEPKEDEAAPTENLQRGTQLMKQLLIPKRKPESMR
jgi:hypothetical protein